MSTLKNISEEIDRINRIINGNSINTLTYVQLLKDRHSKTIEYNRLAYAKAKRQYEHQLHQS